MTLLSDGERARLVEMEEQLRAESRRVYADLVAAILERTVATAPPEGLCVAAVEYGEEHPGEIDSLWATPDEAQKRADEMNESYGPGSGMWRVTTWTLRGSWEPQDRSGKAQSAL